MSTGMIKKLCEISESLLEMRESLAQQILRTDGNAKNEEALFVSLDAAWENCLAAITAAGNILPAFGNEPALSNSVANQASFPEELREADPALAGI